MRAQRSFGSILFLNQVTGLSCYILCLTCHVKMGAPINYLSKLARALKTRLLHASFPQPFRSKTHSV